MQGLTVLVLATAATVVVAPSARAELPVTVGEHVLERFESPHPYVSSGGTQPMLTWADTIEFPGATYIAVHFERMELAAGDSVVVRSPDGAQSWTYTRFGRNDLGATPAGFYATHIKGDTAVIELFTVGGSGGWGYAVDRYGRGYNNDEIQWFWSQGLGEEMNLPKPSGMTDQNCGTDDTDEAKCYQVSEPEIYDASRAVARLLLNGSVHCTGWLVGSAGHLMTNQHCIGAQTILDNVDFEFMAEGPDCATSCASPLACPGTIEASGGTLVQADATYDYALVIPDTSAAFGTDLPATYGFMRLRESGAVLGERIYLPQHPAGWGKRIGVFSTYPEDVSLGGYCYVTSLDEPPCSGDVGDVDVGYWTDTQGGSSGSPVLGISDHKVVALHHCQGPGSCSSGTPSDVRNLGVPIQDVIASLGANVPPDALCDPYAGPTTLTATVPGDNQIDLVWDAVAGSGITYTVKRAVGACPQPSYETIATGLAGTSYSDTTVSGGITYSYVVAAVNGGDCESVPSPCGDAPATGACVEPPTFAGLEALVNPQNGNCSLELAWSAATPSLCGSAVTYSVYRSESPGFTPGPANLAASCLTGTSFVDTAIASQTFYSYVVRAEDDTGFGAGPCNSGNEDGNLVEMAIAASGPPVFFSSENFDTDDGGLVGTLDWEWGAAYSWSGAGCANTPAPPPTAHSGAGMWGTVLNDCYSNFGNNAGYDTCTNTAPADDSILSFQVDLTGTGAAQMCWWEWPDIFLAYDWGQVYANGDTVFEHCGTTYTAPTEWLQQCVDLSGYAGQVVDIEFHMMASSVVERAGWYIDDLEVFLGADCASTLIFDDDFEAGTTSAWSSAVP